MHCYVTVIKQRNIAKFLLKASGTIQKSLLKLRKRELVGICRCFLQIDCVFTRDIEKNPGPTPMHVDYSKTIAAPYSQGNELVFGKKAGQQCVAMILCSLIYNTRQSISSAQVLIMNFGNQLYSSLSQLARQFYLMQTELPTMLNVFHDDYQLEYSESYSGTVHRETIVEGYQYCITLQRAFESLISDGY